MLSVYLVLVFISAMAFKVAGGSLRNIHSACSKKLPSHLDEEVSVVSPTT